MLITALLMGLLQVTTLFGCDCSKVEALCPRPSGIQVGNIIAPPKLSPECIAAQKEVEAKCGPLACIQIAV